MENFIFCAVKSLRRLHKIYGLCPNFISIKRILVNTTSIPPEIIRKPTVF